MSIIEKPLSLHGKELFNPPSLKIDVKGHFWESGLARKFELTGIVPLYLHVLEHIDILPRYQPLEFPNGNSTLVYLLDRYENIQLITGWKGVRKSKNLPKLLERLFGKNYIEGVKNVQ